MLLSKVTFPFSIWLSMSQIHTATIGQDYDAAIRSTIRPLGFLLRD